MTCDGTRMMMALFPTLKGAAALRARSPPPHATPITTYHHIKHALATSHKYQVNSHTAVYGGGTAGPQTAGPQGADEDRAEFVVHRPATVPTPGAGGWCRLELRRERRAVEYLMCLARGLEHSSFSKRTLTAHSPQPTQLTQLTALWSVISVI